MAMFDRPFRRLGEPVLVPVGLTASEIVVPSFPASSSTYYLVNSNICWVRLRGTQPGLPFVPAAENQGWLFPPGFVAVFSSQFPAKLSAIAVARPGFPIDSISFVPLELSYGVGS